MNTASAAPIPFALLLAFFAMLAHPAMLYAKADVSCLADACEYCPPAKDFTRYAGIAVSEPVPPNVERALLSFEAKGFYTAWPVSPLKISTAIWDALWNWHRIQNTSGIEQQIAKNVFVGSERTLRRKYREAIYAIKIYNTYSKVEILRIYAALAQTGVTEYGFQEGARTYFRKGMKDLTLAEAMMHLVAMPNPDERWFRYYGVLCEPMKAWIKQTYADYGFSDYQADTEIDALNDVLWENRKKHPFAFRNLPAGEYTDNSILAEGN